MKEIKISKLFNGKASLRSYTVEKYKDEGITVKFKNEYMNLSPEDLTKGTTDGYKFRSKWGNLEYTLIDFPWKPSKEQIKLF